MQNLNFNQNILALFQTNLKKKILNLFYKRNNDFANQKNA